VPSDVEIRQILRDPGLSNWLRVALGTALERDPVDAASDAALLAMVLERRAKEIAARALADLAVKRARGGC
jgi:hypothetical protein